MVAQMTCQASLQFGMKKAASKPTYQVPAGGPLTLGWNRQTTNFAVSSGAMDAYPKWNNGVANFVRPDVDQSVEESWTAFNRSPSKAASPSSSRPQFRSALEQVSFETSDYLMERGAEAKPRTGNRFGGMAARFFGR